MGFIDRLFGRKGNTSTQNRTNTPKNFDANNPNEILKIVGPMCLIAANAGDSHVYVALQDENPDKGFSKSITLLASIDNCSISCTYDAASYRKLGVTPPIAQYLATVPFKTKDCVSSYDFEIRFTALPDFPSSLTNLIISEMQRGVSQSNYIIAGVRNAQINANAGVLNCSID